MLRPPCPAGQSVDFVYFLIPSRRVESSISHYFAKNFALLQLLPYPEQLAVPEDTLINTDHT